MVSGMCFKTIQFWGQRIKDNMKKTSVDELYWNCIIGRCGFNRLNTLKHVNFGIRIDFHYFLNRRVVRKYI
jgi:hypothetical protein